MAPIPGDSSKSQFGTSMPQGGHPPHHSITSSTRLCVISENTPSKSSMEKPPQISKIFTADSVKLDVSHQKDGKLRVLYWNWDNHKVVEPDEVLELRAARKGREIAP